MTKLVKKQQYIAQNVEMIRSAAYETLSGNAVKLLIQMQTHWRMYEPIAYSVTEAQTRVGCSRGKAHEALRELETHGFIKLMLDGHFYKQLARKWRLTFREYNNQNPVMNGETGNREIDLLIHNMNAVCLMLNASCRIVNRCSVYERHPI